MAMTINQTGSGIEVEPNLPIQASVIWLHGLGADGGDFVPLVSELHLPPTIGIRFIFPHAPIIPITAHHGYETRAWYDIASFNLNDKTDTTGIHHSMTRVQKLIEKEIAHGTTSDRIILAGFSQGAVMALMTGLCYPDPLAGIIALSGYLPSENILLQIATHLFFSLMVVKTHWFLNHWEKLCTKH